MKAMFTQLLTGSDNSTHDIVRWLAAFGGLTGLCLQIFDVTWHHTKFDIQAFGIGLGSMLAGVGAALRLGMPSEPKP